MPADSAAGAFGHDPNTPSGFPNLSIHYPRMEFRYDDIEKDVLILAVDGGLNSTTADEFIHDIEALVDAGLTRVIVDCSGLTHISSYGLSVLIRLHRHMRNRGGDVKLCSIRGIASQALQITRLDGIFDIYPDLNRARLAFRPTSDEDH